MCIIIVKPARVQLPDYATLCRCARNNPDGFGFAIPGKKPYKALDFEKFVDSINKVDEDLPMIIHFRKATHGSIKKANCHPFRDNDNGISFAHNGMLNGISTAHDKTDSETAFNLIFVPAIEKFGFGTAKFKQTIETIRGYSRFAFLTDNGTIKTYGQFTESNGCLYSNGGYLGY